MKYGSITLGQFEALVNMIGGEREVRGILDGTLKVDVIQVHKLLRPVGKSVFLVMPDPQKRLARLETDGRLSIGESFERNILSAILEQTGGNLKIAVELFGVVESTNDTSIRSELGVEHIFSAGQFASIIVDMITQSITRRFDLGTSGKANVFYVVGNHGEVFAVHVEFSGMSGMWNMGARSLYDDPWAGWDEGDRVFGIVE